MFVAGHKWLQMLHMLHRATRTTINKTDPGMNVIYCCCLPGHFFFVKVLVFEK